MKNLFGRFCLYVILPLGMAVAFMYPPSARNLISFFQSNAGRQDETFNQIVSRARDLEKTRPEQTFAFSNLRDAIGTNDITKYFPQIVEAKNQPQPTTFILNHLQRRAAGKIKQGIDLQGGTAFQVRMKTDHLGTNSDSSAILSEAIEVLRKRIDKFGVAEPIIQPEGDNQISIQLPGLSEANREEAKKRIQQAAFLEFRMVHENNDQLIQNGQLAGQIVPPGYELMKSRASDRKSAKPIETVLVRKKAEMTGSAIRSAFVSRGNFGEPQIVFRLNSEGAAQFGELTRKYVNHRMAIVLDGELYSAPNIKEPIEGGTGNITGDFDVPEARRLASALENPLRAPLEIVHSNDVEPTLGRDSVESGFRAAIYGVILVSAFMLIYYLFSGLVANAALCLNLVLLLGAMCAINTTLTMPGIAGIVLTIGMAVDANVLIFERIREEMAAGKSVRGALAAGYNKAFGTIFDSNLTTLISSVILIFMGTGPVKGFGVTLTIGVGVSMFTSLVVTRLIFDFAIEKGWLKQFKMMNIIGVTKIDFMKWAIPAFAASWLLILVGNGYGIFVRGADVFGVEFTGGTTITFDMAQEKSKEVPTKRIQESLADLKYGDFLASYQRAVGTGSRTLAVTTRAVAEGEEQGRIANIIAKLQKDFPDTKFQSLGSKTVGPTIGASIRDTAVLATFLALFGILVYVAFRYELSFSVGAVIAILHDLLMTMGAYFIAGYQMNATTVAALLTIIGFSINDTIVIFDRIREDLKLGMRGSFREIINTALNQTLSRTIITSGTVFLSTLSLYLFGGGVINDFAFAFLIGVLTGCYSTIYIASAIVLWWHKGQRPKIGGTVPAASSVDLTASVNPATQA